MGGRVDVLCDGLGGDAEPGVVGHGDAVVVGGEDGVPLRPVSAGNGSARKHMNIRRQDTYFCSSGGTSSLSV